MRIIGGKLGGIRLQPPSGLPVRPTMDLAKEALFNILQNRLEIGQLNALDLFSGTGNIALELASRDAISVLAVDKHPKCVQYIKEMGQKYQLDNLQVQREDVLKFLKSPKGMYFDLIFADPPFDLPQLTQLPALILNHQWLSPGGTFVLEHPSTKKVDQHPGFKEQRKYGYSSFSFFSI
ncbi:16S rRNA (guanine(966)-N(2))-methyltransferase RsmD [bacterium A37T11]|nr:16S rRNA (guanine(966)-N(2))-methyltransferase RsmD [bacterium A37T11]